VGYIGFAAHALAEAGLDLSVPIEFENGGATRRVELRLSTPPVPWFRIPVLLAYVITALLVLVRGAQAAQARRFFAAFMSLFLIEMPFDGPAYAQTVASQTLFHLVGGIAVALTLRWAILFPEEMAAAHRISPHWAWMAALLWYAGRLNYLTGFPLAPKMLPAVTLATDWLIAIVFLAVLGRNYAHATPIGRRRIRWLTYGVYMGSLCYGLTSTLGLLDPASPWLDELYLVSALALILLPLGTLVGLLRYNLFDVDRLISATLSYNLVGVAVVAFALGMVPRVAHAVSASIGIDPGAGELALSVLLAAIVVPAHRPCAPRSTGFCSPTPTDSRKGSRI
jgi:hypothetical protein